MTSRTDTLYMKGFLLSAISSDMQAATDRLSVPTCEGRINDFCCMGRSALFERRPHSGAETGTCRPENVYARLPTTDVKIEGAGRAMASSVPSPARWSTRQLAGEIRWCVKRQRGRYVQHMSLNRSKNVCEMESTKQSRRRESSSSRRRMSAGGQALVDELTANTGDRLPLGPTRTVMGRWDGRWAEGGA